jgi:hypothetical protein
MKMIKRTLIAIAVIALVASAAQALGPDPHFFEKQISGELTPDIAIKVNNETLDIGWPFEYKKVTICTIPVFMNVGYYVELEDCADRKIELQQVDCGDISKGSGDFPCYFDCDTVRIRANFLVEVSTDKKKMSGSIMADWDTYVDGDKEVPADGSWKSITVCVKAWKVKLLNHAPGSKVKVGDLVVQVRPKV